MQRTESVEYIKQNLILHVKGIVIKWTVVRISISHVKCLKLYLFLKRATEIFFARRGTNLPFIQELLYNFVSRSDSIKILCAQTENKKRNEKFSKTPIFELFNFFYLNLKKS